MPPLTPRLAVVPEGHAPEEYYNDAGLVEYYDARLAELSPGDPAAPQLIGLRARAARGAAAVAANITEQLALDAADLAAGVSLPGAPTNKSERGKA